MRAYGTSLTALQRIRVELLDRVRYYEQSVGLYVERLQRLDAEISSIQTRIELIEGADMGSPEAEDEILTSSEPTDTGTTDAEAAVTAEPVVVPEEIEPEASGVVHGDA